MKTKNLYLIALLILGLSVRFFFLNQPMRFDESMTFLEIVNRPSRLFYFHGPNNQVAHTVLVKGAVAIFGPHPAAIRLPAFLAGIAAIPLISVLCRRFGTDHSGILAPLGMAILPYLILFSTNARGYSLLVLLTVLLVILLLKYTERPSMLCCGAVSLVSALGMLTLPSMAFPLAGLYIWTILVLVGRKTRFGEIFFTFALPWPALTLIFTFLLYIPVIRATGGLSPIIHNRFMTPQPWNEFINGIPGHIREVWGIYTRDIPLPAQAAAGLLFLGGIAVSAVRRAWSLLFLFPSLLLGSALVLIVNHRIPFTRTWIFFIPFFLVVADAGFAYFINKASFRLQKALLPALVVLGTFFAGNLALRDAIAYYPDTGFFPEAEAVAMHLKTILEPGDVVHVYDSDEFPLSFYLWYNGLPPALTNIAPDPQKQYYVVHRRNYSIADMEPVPVAKIAGIGQAEIWLGK